MPEHSSPVMTAQLFDAQQAPVGSLPPSHGPQPSITRRRSATPTVPSPFKSASGSALPQALTIARISVTSTNPSPLISASHVDGEPHVLASQAVLSPLYSPPLAVHSASVVSKQSVPKQQAPFGSPPPSQSVQSPPSHWNSVQFR